MFSISSDFITVISLYHKQAEEKLKTLDLLSTTCVSVESLFKHLPKYSDDNLSPKKNALQLKDIVVKQCALYKEAAPLSKKLSEKFEKMLSCNDELDLNSYNPFVDISGALKIADKAKEGSVCAQVVEDYLIKDIPEYRALIENENSLLLEAKSFCDNVSNEFPEFQLYCSFVGLSEEISV